MRTERGKELPKTFESDVRVKYERLTDRYFICMSVEIAVKAPETQGRPSGETSTEMQVVEEEEEPIIKHIAAIDPGIRTFVTLYDPGRERIVEWGMHGGRKDRTHDGTKLLGWLTRKIGRLENAAKQAHKRHRQRIRKLANRIRHRVIDLTTELHHKLALWLCQNYSVVLLPKFNAKGISRRKGLPAGKRRAICRNATRKLAQMSPFTFRQFLLHKAREFGTQVLICDEYFTSKTCTNCGMLNHDLGASKTLVCPACSATYDRDAGAARNILLRYIS
jgi:putative transposase